MKPIMWAPVAAALVLGWAAVCSADKAWNAGNADWYGDANWSPAGVPSAADTTTLTNNGTAQLNVAGTNAHAANLYLGHDPAANPGGRGHIVISNGMLTVVNNLRTGKPYTGFYGTLTQGGGVVQVGASLTLGAADSRYRLNAGSLNVVSNLVVGDAYQTSYFDHHAGNVVVGNDLNIGTTGQGGNNAYVISNGTLTVGRNFNVTIGGAVFRLEAGTVVVSNTFNAGSTADFVINLNGGSVTAGHMHVGERYSNKSRIFYHNGSDITVDGTVSVRGSNVVYALREGRLSVGRGGQLTVGGGDHYGANRGEFQFNVVSNGPTELTEHGAGAGAGLKLRDYGTGFGLSRLGECVGTFRGWGVVGFSGTLNNSGRVIADGGGQDRTLDLSGFAQVANTFDNTTNYIGTNTHWVVATNTGWYAMNGGKLRLPGVTNVAAGDSVRNWGEAAADATPDLINSVRIGFTNVTAGGDVDMSLLATNRTDVRVVSPGVIGLWQVTAPGLTFGPGGGATFTFRYDTILASALGIDPATLKVWHFTGVSWSDVTAGAPDLVNGWITANARTALRAFAVGPNAPAPSGGTLIMIR